MALPERRRRCLLARPEPTHFTYSRWDGSQAGTDLDADHILRELAEDLLYHGDPAGALRRLTADGFHDRVGHRLEGLRSMLERLGQQRRDILEQHDLGGVYEDIAEDLRDVIRTERQALHDLDTAAAQARSTGDQHQPRVRFADPEKNAAAQARSTGDQHQPRVRFADPEKNAAAQARSVGDQHRADLTARTAAAKNAQLDLLPPDLAGQFKALDDYDFESDQARRQFAQLTERLREQFMKQFLDRTAGTAGEAAGGSGPASQDMQRLQSMLADLADIGQLENLLRSPAGPDALAEPGTEAVRRLLGDGAAASLEQMAALSRMLEEAGLIENRAGRIGLTPRAVRKIGQGALRDLFARLDAGKLGHHTAGRSGRGHEREHDIKPYTYGEPFNLHVGRTVRNAVARTGGGVPVRLHPEDFEVERTEQQVRSATVLMLDLSLSMPMRNNFLPAKKVAMALHSLISSQYPRDYLGLVSFSEVAREFRPEKLPEVSWDYVYGTNMQHGFMLARSMLERQAGTKQIIIVTDGEPTAHIAPSGRPYFSYPPTRETVDLTLAEVGRCTRDGIRINTFMLDATPRLTKFVERVTEMNGGRAFFTTNENLGDYLLVDFVDHKRSLLGARS